MKHRDGFTLIEIVVVLFILGIVLTMAAQLSRGITASQQRSLTTGALARADLALVGYVQTMRRLPCPADGALASSDPAAGREMRTGAACDNLQAHGVVPWVTLGMREDDVLDGYAVRLTYRVGPDLVSNDALNMSSCDAAGAAPAALGAPGRCEPACVDHAAGLPGICTKPFNAIAGRGLQVQNAGGVALADPALGTGAAYVVISHGANHGGGYGVSGTVQDVVGAALTAGEIQNAAASPLAAFYVDDASSGDDALSRPSIFTLLIQTGLGPRIHQP